MDQFPQMLYKAPGTEPIHGGHFACLIVADDAEHGAALADGWHETTTDALEAHKASLSGGAGADAAKLAQGEGSNSAGADDAPPTRAELEAKATELGIEFNHRWGDKKLGDTIAAKLAQGEGA